MSKCPDCDQRGPIIFDRYWQSAFVYGVARWSRSKVGCKYPVADVARSRCQHLDRRVGRRKRRDRYEANREYLEKVRKGYLYLWGERSQYIHGDAKRWRVVDGLGTVEEVALRIEDACRLAMGVS